MISDRSAPSLASRRFTGALLGLMVGDALGLPREGLSARRAARLWGTLPKHVLLPGGRGLISDDSEHALLTIHAWLRSRGDVARFRSELARGIRWWALALPAGAGKATLHSALRLWAGVPPERSGVRSAGNGPAMRAPILGIGLANSPLSDCWAAVDAATLITHTDPRAVAAARLLALAGRLAVSDVPASDLAANFQKSALTLLREPEDRDLIKRLGVVSELQRLTPWSPEAALAAMGAGKGVSGFIPETAHAALLCWLRHPEDYPSAMKEIISLGGDSDSTAAIVGALCGARVGREGIPAEWLDGVVDWPLSVGFARRTAEAWAADAPSQLPHWPSYSLTLLRNLVFLTVVLIHVFRRCLPPTAEVMRRTPPCPALVLRIPITYSTLAVSQEHSHETSAQGGCPMNPLRLFRGRGPVRLIAIAFAVAIILLALPSVLRLAVSRSMDFPHALVREPGYVKPYGYRPRGGTVMRVLDLYGRETITQPKGGSYPQGISLTSGYAVYLDDRFVTASAVGSAELKNDGRIELMALVLSFPDGRNELLGPGSTPLDEDAFPEAYELAHAQLSAWDAKPPADCYAQLRVILRGSGPAWDQRDMIFLRDATTGLALADPIYLRGGGMPPRPAETATGTIRLLAPPPGPVSLWFVARGSEVVYKIPVQPGASFQHRGRTIALKGVVEREAGSRTIKMKSVSGGTTLMDGDVAIEFTPNLVSEGEQHPAATLFLKDGTTLLGSSSMWDPDGYLRLFAYDSPPAGAPVITADDLVEVELRYETDRQLVVFEPDGLAAKLGSKEAYRDLGKLPLPNRTLTNYHEVHEVLRYTLQTCLSQPQVPPFPPAASPAGALPFPIKTDGMTAGELFAGWRANYPAELDTVWGRYDGVLPYLALLPEGTIASKHPTLRTRLIRLCQQSWMIVGGMAIFVGLIKAWMVMQALRIQRTLRSLGYERMTFFDAELLYLLLGGDAHRIPPHDHFASLPGVDPDSPASIAKAMEEARGKESPT